MNSATFKFNTVHLMQVSFTTHGFFWMKKRQVVTILLFIFSKLVVTETKQRFSTFSLPLLVKESEILL